MIVTITILYTNFLSSKLANEERAKVAQWVLAQQQINDMDNEDVDNCDFTLQLNILQSNTTIPVIIVNDREGIDWAANFGPELDTNEDFLKKEVSQNESERLQTYRRVCLFHLL